MSKVNSRDGKTWPAYILGGRMRTSTLVLIVAFLGVGWLYETYEPPTTPTQVPASEVVPPGFVPDPNYTWAPRTDVQRHNPTTTESTPTTSTTPTTPTSPAASTASPAPGEPTPSSSAATAPGVTATPAPASPTTGSAAPSAPERPAAATPTPAVPASGAAPFPQPPTQ